MAFTMSAEEQEVVKRTKQLVEEHGRLDVSWDDPKVKDMVPTLRKSKVRHHLSTAEQVVVSLDPINKQISLLRLGVASSKAVATTTPQTAPKPKKEPEPEKPKVPTLGKKHKYEKPWFHEDMKRAIQAGLVVQGVGAPGTGKTHHAHILADELNMELFLVNCNRDMDMAAVLGEKTIAIDEKTKQNYVKFMEGPVLRAMTCGLDEKGNEVGPKPGLLVLDEFPTTPTWIAIGLNNMLDSFEERRKVCVTTDGGRRVTAHSGFRIVLFGNTIGRGHVDEKDHLLTAQADALDYSTLSRYEATFEYYWNEKAEANILRQKIGDDRIVKDVLKFRDAIRDQMRLNNVDTMLTTRHIVTIGKSYGVYSGDIGKAIYFGVITNVPGNERQIFNEAAQVALGEDLERKYRPTRRRS